jgi:Ca-activated chloride channel family protein
MEDLSGQEKTQKVTGAFEITMEKDELKKLLNRLPIPEPDEEARERALSKAMEEFCHLKKADEEHFKGFSLLNRLRRKNMGGGPVMRKSFAVSAAIAFSLMLLVAVMIPNFSAYRSAPTSKGTYTRAPAAKHDVAPLPVRSRLVSGELERGFPKREERLRQPTQAYVGRDRFETITPNPVKLVQEEPVSTFSIDVDTASYAFVRRALHSGVLPQKDAVRIEELINYFAYDYPLPEDRATPFRPTIAVIPTPWNPDTKLIHIGIKGFDVVPGKEPRSNLVFLIDVSGSMRRPDKLPLLKNALRMLVETLDPQDVVSIVVYAGAAGTVLEPTTVREKGRILATLDRLTAGGSTAGGEGIRQAYALAEANFDPQGINRVILATDGDFNVGIRNPEELKGFVERKRQSGVYLTVLGFGQGNYNDALMQKLAQNGNGTAAYIDTLNEARKVLVDEAHAALFPIANDVKIQVEFNPARVAEYRLIGYETRLLRREDFKNDLVDAGDVGAGHSITAFYEVTPTSSKARLIDELRYARREPTGNDQGGERTDEFAFLKIRYKLPEEKTSRLIETPIGMEKEYKFLDSVPGEVRFASAVAAFGQLLRGDPYVKTFTYKDVIDLAGPARGKDLFGLRTEFLNLVRLATTARAMDTQ